MIATAKPQTIPQSLIYEVHNGQPIYYRGYKDVLKGIKTDEQIMGSSILQSLLVTHLSAYLVYKLKGQYLVLSNELGLQIGRGEERAADIALFPKDALKGKLSSTKYANLPPEIMIEVDTKADLSDFENPQTYYYEKNEELLKWGGKTDYLDNHRFEESNGRRSRKKMGHSGLVAARKNHWPDDGQH